jgi:hypothetical protein
MKKDILLWILDLTASGENHLHSQAEKPQPSKLIKTVLLFGLVLSASARLQGQGTVNFSNVGAPVTNVLTMQRVPAGTAFSVALYYGPDGTPADASLIQIGARGGFVSPGIFLLGTRTTPATTPPGGFAVFQVRVWESRFGSTYEEAIRNPNQLALVGRSACLRVKTGAHCTGLEPARPSLLRTQRRAASTDRRRSSHPGYECRGVLLRLPRGWLVE